MLKLTITVEIPNLDKRWIALPCAVCGLETPVTLGAIRHGDTIVCRGCHANVRLHDHLGALHRFERHLMKLLSRIGS